MNRFKIVVFVSFILFCSSLFGLMYLFPVPGSTVPTLRQPATPPVIMEVLDPSLNKFAPMWREEIGRRFDNAVGILCHGGDPVAGEWYAGSSDQPWKHVSRMTDIVRKYQRLYPDRTIILLACNTGHLKLGIPGVYYAHSSVWCIPDRGLKASHFSDMANRKLDDPEDWEDVIRKLVPATDPPTRWQLEPEVVGNIYEFKKD